MLTATLRRRCQPGTLRRVVASSPRLGFTEPGSCLDGSAAERARAQRYSKAADVFSFAVVLWELAVWRLPWEDLGPFQARAPPSATVGPRRGLVPAAAAIAIFLPRACFSEGGRLM